MKPRLLIGAVGVLLLGASATVDAQRRGKSVVAVLPFTSPTRWDVMGRNAQATFVTELVKARKVRVVQAGMVTRMLRRRGLHWTGVVEPRLLKAARRWLKADYVLAGKLRYAGDAFVLSAHVMDVRTLETTMAEDIDFRNTGKMRVAVRALARKVAGAISGTGSRSSNAELFLNVDARAFYDTADACIRVMRYQIGRYRFSGSVDEVDDGAQLVKISGHGGRLVKGVPLDIAPGGDVIDGPERVNTVYFERKIGRGIEARARFIPDDGIPLGARVGNADHKWVVAVGKIVDEAEDNDKLVERFRSALLEKMSEGELFQQIEGGQTDLLAKLSSRRQRFFAFRKLFERGIEAVLEGKLYGSVGNRRAHFKLYSTMTGKVLGELKFETSL